MAAQTAAAAVATFAVVQVADMPEGSWAVISALFVVQQSVGGTVGAGMGRIIGTALGTVIGLAGALLLGTGGWNTAIGLLIAAAALSLVSANRPSLRYGIVPAAIILLAPGGDVVDQSWDRALAVIVGTVVGVLSALVVFPEPAHRGAEAHMGRVLRHCADLLSTSIERLTGGDEGDLMPIHDAIRTDLQSAKALSGQTLYPHIHIRSTGPDPRALLHAVQRLWHSLILIDRAQGPPIPEGLHGNLTSALDAVARTSCSYLNSVGDNLTYGKPPPSPELLERDLKELDRSLSALREQGEFRPLSVREIERVFVLTFAFREIADNFREIDTLFRDRTDQPRRHAA